MKSLRELYDAVLKDIEDHPLRRKELAFATYGPHPGDDKATAEKRTAYAEKKAESEWGLMEMSEWVRRQYRDQRSSPEKNPFDLDVAVAFREHKGRYIIIPYPGSGFCSGCLKFLKRHPALEDYHYQNQSDQPHHIPVREWSARGKVWDFLLEDDRFPDKLVLDIVTYDGFQRVDPWFKHFSDSLAKKMREDTAKARKEMAKKKKEKAA